MVETDNKGKGDPFQYWGFIGNEYVEQGLHPFARLVAPEAAGIEQKFRHLFEFNKEKVIKRVIIPHLIYEMTSMGIISNRDVRGDEITEQDNMDRFLRSIDVLDGVVPGVKKKWNDLVERMYAKTYHLIVKETVLAYSYQLSMNSLAGSGLARARLMAGKKRDDEGKTFSGFDSLLNMLTTSNKNISPYAYLAGNPGTGKSNGLGLIAAATWRQKNWIYGNIPIVGDRTHRAYQVRRLTDLFTDTKDKPSIIRMMMISEEMGVEIGATLIADEKGKGLSKADRSTTTEGLWQMQFDQLRRHFRISVVEGGVKQKDPKQEEFVEWLITAMREPINVYDEFGERKYRYGWTVDHRTGDTTWDRQVYNEIPLSETAAKFSNKIELTPLFQVDMSVGEMEKAVGGFDQDLEELNERCDAWASERQERMDEEGT